MGDRPSGEYQLFNLRLPVETLSRLHRYRDYLNQTQPGIDANVNAGKQSSAVVCRRRLKGLCSEGSAPAYLRRLSFRNADNRPVAVFAATMLWLQRRQARKRAQLLAAAALLRSRLQPLADSDPEIPIRRSELKLTCS